MRSSGASRPFGIDSRTEPRYQNFLTEDYLCEDAAYVEPIPVDFYEHAKCFTSPKAKEEDSHSYQNVFIGDTCGSGLDDVDDYENSPAIHAWKSEQSAAALYIDSQDEEPDYVNTNPCSRTPPCCQSRVNCVKSEGALRRAVRAHPASMYIGKEESSIPQ
uniref:Uncharacterized protein n=1 Tax=Anas platyrhynchos TaxID=8839 RepID=A0A8B9TLK8_ANAPL